VALRIVSADERMAAARTKNTALILGSYGIGKTSLAYTLPAETTLFLDFEAGTKSIEKWRGDVIQLRTWMDAADIACLLGGVNPAVGPNDLFSKGHFDAVSSQYKDLDLAKYQNVFFDSISELSFVSKLHSKQTAYEKGVLNNYKLYGDLADETLGLLRHMQHAPGRNVFYVARLECVIDAYKREVWQPQIEGQKIGRELPGIVDQVISMAKFDFSPTTGWVHNPDKGTIRAFVCHTINPWGLPAKERTMGNIEMIEEPHLGKLLDKINAPAKLAAPIRT